MIHRKSLRSSLALWIAIVLTNGISPAAEWPQWRGPNRDGVWDEQGIAESFSGEQIQPLWRAPISNGYTGPTVAAGRAYVMDRIAAPAETERVLCFDADTGKELWRFEYECAYERFGYPNGPRACVTIDNGLAYAMGAMGHLHCLDAATGALVWRHDLKSEYAIRLPTWAMACAPLIAGDLVVLNIGGQPGAAIVAFDKKTGEERWRALDDRIAYSSPILIEQAGRTVLVSLTAERLAGLDPETGALLWEAPFAPAKGPISVPDPVLHNGHLFVSSFYDGSMLVKLASDRLAAEIVWRRRGASERKTDSLHCMISTPVLQGDHIYGIDSYGEFRCLEIATGDRIWESQAITPFARWSTAHFTRRRDKVWIFNERGELIIGKLSPQGFQEIDRAALLEPTTGQLSQRGGVCWSPPAFAYGRIYVRNDKELLCASLSE
ncbi:MAG: outer membrane biogenesis protein BamB [candidate division BRC1 bacterium ADurb.BinA364]|nr:MAG: outer membrane biogenesis protein BamB [candidate division BRC1 bacterium ADurb.BinA364]